jgi:putative ABC transport system ATP-binding protein
MSQKKFHSGILVVNVKRSFGSGKQAVHVLRGVDLEVKPGQMIGLYGPSGSGKTTLLNLIGALDQPNEGEIYIDDSDVTRMGEGARAKLRRKKIGFIFQNYTLIPTYTALENIDLVLRLPGLGYFERRRRSKAALEAVGLSSWSNHMPDELSGGQKQRIAIARALAVRPAVILADEPTSGLDTRTSRRIMGLFRAFAREQGTTFLVVSHDPVVADFVDHAYDLDHGRVTEYHSSDLAHSDALKKADSAVEEETVAVPAQPVPVQKQDKGKDNGAD